MRTLSLLTLLMVLGVLPLLGDRPAAAQTASCNGEAATIVNKTPGAVVHGTGGRDVIVTWGDNGATQTIYANGGDDLICAGSDVVYAGSGNDTVRAGGGDLVDGGSGDDYLHALGVYVVRGGSGNDTLDVDAVGTCDGGSGSDGFGIEDWCNWVLNIP